MAYSLGFNPQLRPTTAGVKRGKKSKKGKKLTNKKKPKKKKKKPTGTRGGARVSQNVVNKINIGRGSSAANNYRPPVIVSAPAPVYVNTPSPPHNPPTPTPMAPPPQNTFVGEHSSNTTHTSVPNGQGDAMQRSPHWEDYENANHARKNHVGAAGITAVQNASRTSPLTHSALNQLDREQNPRGYYEESKQENEQQEGKDSDDPATSSFASSVASSVGSIIQSGFMGAVTGAVGQRMMTPPRTPRDMTLNDLSQTAGNQPAAAAPSRLAQLKAFQARRALAKPGRSTSQPAPSVLPPGRAPANSRPTSRLQRLQGLSRSSAPRQSSDARYSGGGISPSMQAYLDAQRQGVAGVRDSARKAFQFVAPIAAVAATAALGHKYGTPAYDNHQTRQNAAAHRREYMWRQL